MKTTQEIESLSQEDRELITVAAEHAKERFKKDFISIGGALRTKSGKIYKGINLKYRVRNTSTCAEAMAICSALNDGESEFDTIVGVKYFPETDSFEIVNGCGWCRQLFCYNTPLKVIVADNGRLEIEEAQDLLPLSFL